MTVAVIQFGGSNCDRDTVRGLEAIGIDAELVWYRDSLPSSPSGIVIPGGFSYGDYLRAGAMAGQAPIMTEVSALAGELPILGICNGAQIGCETGLTPGAFTQNASARFQCEPVYLRVERADTPFTQGFSEGQVLQLPIAHGEGRFETADAAVYEGLETSGRILFRYCDAAGRITEAANPNGSRGNVAGVLGEERSTAVLMPHPERAALSGVHDSTDGRSILEALG